MALKSKITPKIRPREITPNARLEAAANRITKNIRDKDKKDT